MSDYAFEAESEMWDAIAAQDRQPAAPTVPTRCAAHDRYHDCPQATPAVCQWFALCTNRADGTVAHPVLGGVPTCSRCAAKLGLEFEGAPE